MRIFRDKWGRKESKLEKMRAIKKDIFAFYLFLIDFFTIAYPDTHTFFFGSLVESPYPKIYKS